MTGSGSKISDLVKEMVKEMDANDFYARGDIYDESLEEPWFNIDIQLEQEGGKTPLAPRASLRKPWSEFQRLHYLLLTDEFGCNASVKDQLPTLPAIQELSVGSDDRAGNGRGVGGHGDAKAGGPKSNNDEVAEKLDAYLNTLLSIPAVVRSQVFGGFLDDGNRRETDTENDVENDTAPGQTSESDGGREGAEAKGDADRASGEELPREPETAIDFLVQPFDYTSAYVPRRASHTERIDVLRGESVVWKFEVLDHLDIDFSVVFRPHPVAVFTHAGEADGLPPEETLSIPRSVEVGGGNDDGGLPNGGVTDAASVNDNAGGTESRGKGKDGSPGDKGNTPRADGGGGWWTGGRSSARVKERMDEDARVLGGKAGAAAGATKAGGDQGEESIVHRPTRYSTSGGDPVQGSFTCASDGTCILKWDNSYSRLRGKRLRFVMESVTVRTMLAAIEAAGAADHKRRAIRSVAAQTILDSSPDQVHITVTAVSITDGAGSAVDGDAESTNDGCSGKSAESRSDGGSAGTYRFGRIRRVAAALLRDLGTLVDAQDTGASSTGRPVVIANKGDGGNGDEGGCGDADEAASVRRGAHDAKPRAEACGADYSKADATGVGKLVERFEQLEDEVASCSARRAQSEAQAKVLLATLQKSNTKVERLERELEDVREQAGALQGRLESTETSRDEAVAAEAASSARRQSLEEELLRTKRERDLLQAERSVWQVARSGIQEELAKVVAELEQERHRHEDASRALSKSRESRALAEAEVARLTRRLEEERGGIGGIRAALAAEREASRLAREEAEDARAAVADLDAAVAELGAQKRVLVAGLRARERALGDRCSAAEARAEESAMMRRAAETRVKELEEEAERGETAQADAEVRLQRLRAEKKVLLMEIRRGAVGGGAGVARASTVAAAAAATGAGDSLGMTGFVGRQTGEGGAMDTGGVKGTRGDREDGEGAAEESTMAGSTTMNPGGDDVAVAGKVTPIPPSPSETVQDNKAMLKQLSRQLVHLRERQHHLREDLAIDPGDQSAQRLQSDLERAVQNLEVRIRKLLAGVTKDGSTAIASSAAGHPAADSRGDNARGSPGGLVRRGERAPLPPSPPKEGVESFAV